MYWDKLRTIILQVVLQLAERALTFMQSAVKKAFVETLEEGICFRPTPAAAAAAAARRR